MLRYVFVFATLSSSAFAAEVEGSYTEVLQKSQLAERCGLQINGATEAWIQNFRKFLSEGEAKVSAESAAAEVDALIAKDPINVCIQVRARLFQDGWL